ncbi:MAG TPA: flavoprotein [Streptosporangiaceae bacterium]|nr:flavoprotein [Streptosporangiaceae bacterium]
MPGVKYPVPGVLYVIGCASPHVLSIDVLIGKAQARGWDVCLVCTPTAAAWLAADLSRLEAATGHPVRSHYKLPGEPDVLPPADAMIVAPATSNTVSKWALAISDTLALGLITEAIGLRLPLVALPCLSAAQAAHPAFRCGVEVLRAAGVAVLLSPDGHTLPQPGAAAGAFPWDLALDELDRRRGHRP